MEVAKIQKLLHKEKTKLKLLNLEFPLLPLNQLVIEDVTNSEGVFSVYPDRAVGRTPVIIRVANPEYLDYESEGGRSFSFR